MNRVKEAQAAPATGTRRHLLIGAAAVAALAAGGVGYYLWGRPGPRRCRRPTAQVSMAELMLPGRSLTRSSVRPTRR